MTALLLAIALAGSASVPDGPAYTATVKIDDV